MSAPSEEKGPELTPFQESVLKLLRGSADAYQERSAVYKDNFRSVGRVMEALFPDGAPSLGPAVDYDRWHIFELIIVKLTRYANNYSQGGHEDSVVDMVAYLGILHALDEEFAQRTKEPDGATWDISPEAQAARLQPDHMINPEWLSSRGEWICRLCGHRISSEDPGVVAWEHE
jgi:hypothetical protein